MHHASLEFLQGTVVVDHSLSVRGVLLAKVQAPELVQLLVGGEGMCYQSRGWFGVRA